MATKTPWLNSAEAANALGISITTLHRRRLDGTFEKGKHYRDVSGKSAIRASYRWHLKRCEDLLNR